MISFAHFAVVLLCTSKKLQAGIHPTPTACRPMFKKVNATLALSYYKAQTKKSKINDTKCFLKTFGGAYKIYRV